MEDTLVQQYSIREVRPSDETAVCAIANHYIENSYASFHPVPADRRYFEGLIKMTQAHAFVVLEHDGMLSGYAFLSALKPSRLFEQTARVAIFLHPAQTGQGLGALLLKALERKAIDLGLTSLISSIASRNEASLKFHAAHGFEERGRLKKVGRKFGRYFDEVLMQKML